MTRGIIASEGFEDYIPTACYHDRRVITVLEGVPEGVNLEHAALEWASRRAESDEEYFVAFEIAPDQFRVVRTLSCSVLASVLAKIIGPTLAWHVQMPL